MLAPDREDYPMQLVPHSGIQFITRFLDLANASRFRRMFVERPDEPNRAQGEPRVWLYADWKDDDPSQQGILPELDRDERYTITAEKALEPYLGKWVPVPYLRTRPGRSQGGSEPFDKGPTNWVRVRATSDIGEHDGVKHTHRMIFAVDTELKAAAEDPSSGPYTAPTEQDAENHRTFRVVSGMSRLSWFIQSERSDAAASSPDQPREDPQLWVEEWLKALFLDFKRASDPGRFRRDPQLQFHHEHSARWLAFIDLIAEHARAPRLAFIDTVSKRINETDASTRTVNVDLVLDVGNSRTCGILMERFPNQGNVELNNCQALRLRDISRPEQVYTEPFDSHVELAAAAFGSEQISRVSGRTRAFFWPSIVRIGREAARLRAEEAGKRTTGGMSSPKRYLWDMEAVQQEWRFPAASYVEGHGPPVERRVRRFVNENGDVISKVSREGKLFRSLYGGRSVPDIESPGSQLKFSRSSFYTFMLAEVIWQAWVMINDPEVRTERGEAGLPRRLRKIILTLPTATPVREQRIMRTRAESALALLWDMMGWTDAAPAGVTMPEVDVRWDEATCVQLVWLYGEVARKFAGNVAGFLELVGRKRVPASGTAREPVPSLRVASLDIGGGTTDLMIITYAAVGDQGLLPDQNFREGVRIAGDDVLKLVVERIVLPAVQQHLQSCGLSFAAARDLLKSSFDDDVPDLTAEDKHRRRELVTEALVPTALALVHAYEAAGPGLYERADVQTLGELVRQEGHGKGLQEVASYLEERASGRGATNFSLAETEIPIDCQMMRAAVNDALGEVFDILAEALDHFDVDVIILSGRPARMPAVTELLTDRFPAAPNRIVPLHRYRAGTWYPFRATENGRIADPKTAVVVGALLCAYAQGQLDDFYYDAELIQMRSTAQYIGILGNDGKLSDQNVLFEAPADGTGSAPDAEKRFDHWGIRQIGSRQLPLERWITAPLYQLSIKTGDRNDVPIRQPIHVIVSRTVEEIDPDDKFAKKLEAEASKEQIKIVEAEDSSPSARNVTQRMVLSFRTIGSDAYWLDNGVLNFP
jgi:hypothetical protein